MGQAVGTPKGVRDDSHLLKSATACRFFEVTPDETKDLIINFDAEKSLTIHADKIYFKAMVELGIRPLRLRYTVPADTAVHITQEALWQNSQMRREIEVAAGDTFTVILGTSTTPSWEWVLAGEPDFSSVTLLGRDVVPPIAFIETSYPGLGGAEIWRFKAGQPGNTTINFVFCTQPCDDTKKGGWTLDLTVRVVE